MLKTKVDFNMVISSPKLSERIVSMLASRGTEATVSAVERLSPRLSLVRLCGRDLGRSGWSRLGWSAGDKIKLNVPPGALRSYTPARFDAAAATMDIVFHLHGMGPAARWAASVRPGETVTFLGPKRSMRSTAGTTPRRALFMGDETTLGLMRALVDGLPAGTSIVGAIELEADDATAIDALDLPLVAVPRRSFDAEHGAAGSAWLRDVELRDVDAVWLSGEADAVGRWVEDLSQAGVSRAQIRAKAYWSKLGHDHRKRAERHFPR